MTARKDIETITQRIRERSKPAREAYLARIADAGSKNANRAVLSCGNLAHGFAVCSPSEKTALAGDRVPNLGIITSYNDMLSAHQPFETYPQLIKQAAREVGGIAQVAGGVPAMCDGVTQGQPGMELSLFSRDVIAMATAVGLSHNMFDAAVYLGVCDKIVPGLVIGALTFGHPNGRNVGHFQINDDFSWIFGRHTFKAGVNARYDQYTYTSIASGAFLGAYSLGDISDFANGKLDFNNPTPSTLGAGSLSSFTQSFPLYGALHFRFPSADFYAGDEWAVTKNLKITYGLRVEEDFNPSCIEKCFVLTNLPFSSSGYQGGVTVPYSNTLTEGKDLFYNAEGPIVQPRVGIAYKPGFANNKMVIRGGIGLFATNYTDGIGGTLANQVPNKFAPSGLTFGSVGVITDPTSSAYTAQASANAFESGFHSGYTLAQIQNAVKPAAFSTPSIVSFPSTYLAPHTLEWSFEVQQELTAKNMLTVSYTANHAWDLQETVNANMYANPSSTILKAAPFYANYGGLPSTPADARFTTVTQYYTNGISNYNALTVLLRHAFGNGLVGQVHYTWSHALGDTSTSTSSSFFNPYNLSNAYGSLGFDNRHQVAGDVLWTQPFKSPNRVVNSLISGWTLGFKMYVYSGAPFSVTDSKIGTDVNSTGVLTPLADLIVPSAFGMSCNSGNSIGQPCMPKTDFATYPSSGISAPLQMDWGNTASNSFRGPGYFDIDGTLQRAFAFKEKYKLVLGIQAYNVLNHPNFANPSGTLTSGSFGEITSTLGPPTSIYGTGQGASVSGRLAVFTGTFTF